MSNTQPPAPFTCTYTPNVPELLLQLGCTLALSTYQAGKVVFISAKNKEHIIQLPRTFGKAMGIALKGNKMAVATKDEVIVLVNSPELALHYPKKPNTYDALFVPRAVYYTGQLDIHDIDWCGDTLYAVNTSFSTIIKIDENYSFTPVWKPPFITKLASEDRCHLNGMAVENEKPKYATAFNNGNTKSSWRDVVTTGGILMDIESNEIIARNLAMPHSPRIYNGQLYLLFSATGELVQMDIQRGKYQVVSSINGFVRGLSIYQDYAFVGLSRLRKNSSTFAKLSIAEKANNAGIVIIHLPTGAMVGQILYKASVDEIYDIQVLPNMVRPNILNTLKPDFKLGLSTPQATYWGQTPIKK